jgi:hypothetical protein
MQRMGIFLFVPREHGGPAPFRVATERRCLPMLQQAANIQTYILRDLTEQNGRYVASRMERDGRRATVRMSELAVRSALTDLFETEPLEYADHFLRGQDRQVTHSSGQDNGLRADELSLRYRLAAFMDHLQDLTEIIP